MCGILGVFATNKPQEVRKRLFEIYNNQKSRGKDGFGFAVSDNGKVTRKRYRTENGVFKNSKFKHVVKNGTGIMVHHRFPTSTRNIVECNHPIADENGNICLIHNGMISNAEELKKSFSAHKFETEITNCNVIKTGNKQYITETEKQFTDSEVLVHVLESGINSKNFRKPLETMLKKISGSYSIAWFYKN
ncbi:MAG: hypothetical protein KAS17_03520, partial [Victivallaceae bacterium]|nr:hypothetical protein [Victivallaceae bacterium]